MSEKKTALIGCSCSRHDKIKTIRAKNPVLLPGRHPFDH